MENKYRLLEHNDIYGFFRYVSMFGARASGKYEQAREAELVYRFKRNGQNAEKFRAMIQGVADHFRCGVVLACPGHTQAETQLQKLLGRDLVRTAEVKSRKYNHKAEIDFDGEAATLDLLRDIRGQRVLFVDDVAITGRTMGFYRRFLAERGATEVVCLVLGLNERLNPTETDFEIAYTTADAKTVAERAQDFRNRQNSIERREPEDKRRRKRLEKNPEAWLRWYFPNTFTLPFSDGHREIIHGILRTDARGMDIVVAAPRGEGKTNILRYMSIYLIVTGLARFVAMGGWQCRSAAEAFSAWKIAVTSERLVADYPEYFAPFAVSTHANRLSRLCWQGEGRPTGAAIKAQLAQIVFPDGRGAIAAGSLQGDIKGLNITTADGAVLRPDKVMLDDPQDVKRAADPKFVAATVKQIDTQWRCLAGPDKRLSMMVACTIYAPDDVGETLGKRRNTVFVRVPRVVSWPEDFDKTDSKTRQLWDRWFDLYDDDKTMDAAVAFYRRNKKEMCRGFAVSWKYRVDESKGDPDAFYSAMVDYYTKGRDAFFSEYQNQPVTHETRYYNLRPKDVLAHVADLQENEVPEDTVFTVLTTDINYSYGLTYEAAAFTRAGTCHVFAEGVWCQSPLPVSAKNTNQEQRQRLVRRALDLMAAWIDVQPWKLDAWYIDAGGEQFDTVTDFCRVAKKNGKLARAMIGRAGKTYDPATKTCVGRVRGRVYPCFTRERGKWYCFDADYHKEMGQASWITPMGEPGSATIYKASHRDYADQMCREVLEAKGVIMGRAGNTVVVYKWNTLPGKHDKLDTHAMAYAAAAYEGLFSSIAAAGVTGGESASDGTTFKRNRRKVYNG